MTNSKVTTMLGGIIAAVVAFTALTAIYKPRDPEPVSRPVLIVPYKVTMRYGDGADVTKFYCLEKGTVVYEDICQGGHPCIKRETPNDSMFKANYTKRLAANAYYPRTEVEPENIFCSPNGEIVRVR